QFVVDGAFPCRVAGSVKQQDGVATGQEVLVGLANLRGVALEGREGVDKSHLPAQFAQGYTGFTVLLVTDDVNQFRAPGSGGLTAGGFSVRILRFRLLDLPQGGVDRGPQFLKITRDQVGAELSLRILVQGVDKRLLTRMFRAGSPRQPDQPLEAAA